MPAQLQPVIADLKKKQGNKDFVSKLVSKAGYPQWNHSKLTKKKSNLAARGTSESESDTTYLYTPFTVDEYKNVQAILITRQVGDALSYKFMLADYYRDFPNYPSAEGGNATATDVAMLFMAFELEVFGHNRMRIKDHDKLFLLSEEQQDAGQFVQNVALARGQGDITSVIVSAFSVTYCWEVWYDPDGDDDPCDCSGNEYYHHDDCETIFFGGGGVSNPSTPDDPTPSQPNTPGPADGGGYIGGGFDYPGGQPFTEDPEPDIQNYHNQGPVATLSGWEEDLPLEPPTTQELLTQMATAINDTANGLFNRANAPTENKEWGFIVVKKNGSLHNKNTVGGKDENFTPMDYTLSNGEKLFGEFHTHQSGDTSSKDRSSFSGDDISVMRMFKTHYQYIQMIECGNVRYALVIEDVTKAIDFFSNKSNAKIHDAIWDKTYSTSLAMTNLQLASQNAVSWYLNPSSTTGIGFYISNNSNKTNFTKLN